MEFSIVFGQSNKFYMIQTSRHHVHYCMNISVAPDKQRHKQLSRYLSVLCMHM